MRSTIAGVVGEQLPRHPDWEVTDSDAHSCRWESTTPDADAPSSLVLTFTQGEWAASARVTTVTTDAVGDEVLSSKITLVEADSLFEALDHIRDWMDDEPTPTAADSE